MEMNEVVIVLGLAILLVTPPCLMDKYEYDDYELSEEEKMSADFDDYDEYSLEEEDDDISDSSDEGDQSEEEDNQDEDETDYGDYVTKGKFVQTDGRQKVCRSHEDCYDQREPQSWCILKNGQSWTDKGCFCAANLRSCVIERRNGDRMEYSYCASQVNWQCSYAIN